MRTPGRDGKSGELKDTATSVDLVFGSTRSSAPSPRSTPAAKLKFVEDFVAAWSKVMMLDRLELGAEARGGAPTKAMRNWFESTVVRTGTIRASLIGSIEVGKKAGMIMLGSDAPSFPTKPRQRSLF
jgi:hypothetical protein